MNEVSFKPLNEFAKAPARSTQGAAGFDVFAGFSPDIAYEFVPGERAVIPTGVSLSIPSGWWYMVCSRSGMAFKNGMLVHNAPGVIDEDYRGELKILMINTGSEPYKVHSGDRIAQIVFLRYETPRIVETEWLPESSRGEGGFGSTGA